MIDLTGPRVIAEQTLVDTCTITRASTDTPELDRTTGELEELPDTPIWTGPCSVNAADTQGLRTDFAGDDRLLNNYIARVPVRAVGIRSGDLFTVTYVHLAGDPDLVGRTFTVRTARARSTIILRRLILVAAAEADAVPY